MTGAYQSAVADCIEGDRVIGLGAVLPSFSHIKMLRFLKKHRKPKLPKTPVPPVNAIHQITNIGADSVDPKGEHHSRKISEPIRPMGLIRTRHQIPTTEGALRSQTGIVGSGINNFQRRIPQLRLPGMGVTTQVSVVGHSYRVLCLMSIPHLDRTARTRACTQGVRGRAERTTRSKHP